MNIQTQIGKPAVYSAIAAVQGELAKHGIEKARRNNSPGGNYNFRGIDDVYNALAPLLAAHGLTILPRILSRDLVERKSGQGKPLFYVTVEAEFDFVAVEDGSVHTVRTFGEAMDSGDKATNKAMSAAYKYAAFMAFAIPTEGDNDADATTHEVAAPQTLSDADWSEIIHLVEATNTDAGKVCQGYSVGSLKELSPEQASNLKGILKGRLEKQAKEPVDA